MGSLTSRPSIPTPPYPSHRPARQKPVEKPDKFWLEQMNKEKERHHKAMSRMAKADFLIKAAFIAYLAILAYGTFVLLAPF